MLVPADNTKSGYGTYSIEGIVDWFERPHISLSHVSQGRLYSMSLSPAADQMVNLNAPTFVKLEVINR
jgi:hypothetical protein